MRQHDLAKLAHCWVRTQPARQRLHISRMFYVAFTRAMKSQYVLSYGTVKNPPIQSSYQQIVNALTERDKQNALRAQGVDPDLLVDDDTAGSYASGDPEPVVQVV